LGGTASLFVCASKPLDSHREDQNPIKMGTPLRTSLGVNARVASSADTAVRTLHGAVSEMSLPKPWFAVWTRSRHEQLVCRELSASGIDTFLPTFTRMSRWSDRKKRITWPLFPGYCFARFDKSGLPGVLACTGVVSVLSNRGTPQAIPGAEIEALQRLVSSGLTFDPCFLVEGGSRVRIVNGPLSGVVGLLIRRASQDQLILAVDVLKSGARLQVPAWNVEPA
jgi:transcriptional antiterminator NusG